jgi:replicative DNA helicase
VFDAEGGGMITMMGGQYGNRPNLDLLLKAHDGDPTTIVRVKNQEPQALVSPQLTIGVLTQPEVLRQVMGVEGAFDRGLLARFMISAPPDPLGHRRSRSAPVPTEVQSRYAALLSSFVNLLWLLVHPYEMNIDPDALEMLRDFQDEIEPRRPRTVIFGRWAGSRARSSDQPPDSPRCITSAGTDQMGSSCRPMCAASPVASSWLGTPSSITAM